MRFISPLRALRLIFLLCWSAGILSVFSHDAHGNVRHLSDSSGNLTDTFDYDAFGNLIARGGTTPTTRLFTGEEFDSDLGLYNLRARYHNPGTGRFWTRDSFEGFLNNPASRHGYSYAQNNPVTGNNFTTYDYNLNRQLTCITRPDGVQINYAHSHKWFTVLTTY